jgi:hypothetical protein
MINIPGQNRETTSAFAEPMDYERFWSLQQGLIDMIGKAIGDPLKIEVLDSRLELLHEAHPEHFERATADRQKKLQEV